uniref:Uncharacterized protein n=1 Tax=Heterorhabditis bacteriophora TaxID=37862 RepID=A0A1I7W6N1_HETBA
MAMAVEETNLHRRIALGLLKKVGNASRLPHYNIIYVSILSFFVSDTACTALMTPIAIAILITMQEANTTNTNGVIEGWKNGEEETKDKNSAELLNLASLSKIERGFCKVRIWKFKNKLNWILAIKTQFSCAYGSLIGGTAIITSTGPNLVFRENLHTFYPNDEVTMTYLQWMTFAMPPLVFYILASHVVLTRKTTNEYNNQLIVSTTTTFINNIKNPSSILLIKFVMTRLFSSLHVFQMTFWRLEKGQSRIYKLLFFSQVLVLRCDIILKRTVYCVFLGPIYLFSWFRKQSREERNLSLIVEKNVSMAYDELGPISFAEKSVFFWFCFLIATWILRKPGFIPGWGHIFPDNGSTNCFNHIYDGVRQQCFHWKHIHPNCPQYSKCSELARLCAESLSVHPLYLALPATVGCSFAFMLPMATPPNAIVYDTKVVNMIEMHLKLIKLEHFQLSTGFFLNLLCILITVLNMNTWTYWLFNLSSFPDLPVRHNVTTKLDI